MFVIFTSYKRGSSKVRKGLDWFRRLRRRSLICSRYLSIKLRYSWSASTNVDDEGVEVQCLTCMDLCIAYLLKRIYLGWVMINLMMFSALLWTTGEDTTCQTCAGRLINADLSTKQSITHRHCVQTVWNLHWKTFNYPLVVLRTENIFLPKLCCRP